MSQMFMTKIALCDFLKYLKYFFKYKYMTDVVLIFWISLPCAFVGFAAKWKQKKRISHFNIISYVDSLI